MRLIYLIGAPGSGKSTLMAALTEGCIRIPVETQGLRRDALFRNGHQVGVELGRRRGSFSGTDALGMAVHPIACKWIATTDEPLVLAEGQRLATTKFLRAAMDANREVDLVWVDPGPEVCESRRNARGSQQNPAWIKGATTRVNRLAEAAQHMPGLRLHRLAGHGSTGSVEAHAREALRLQGGLA